MSTFQLRKMTSNGASAVEYNLADIKVNDLLGAEICLEFTGKIFCIECGRKISKSFNQGYCFPCFKKLAACDLCILKPELCHFRKGSCREANWALDNCFEPHIVYLSNTSDIKVGITRQRKMLGRWVDQGASSAIKLALVPERFYAGQMEAEIRKTRKDRTDWRALVKGLRVEADLVAEKAAVVAELGSEWSRFVLNENEVFHFHYPVIEYPSKPVSYKPNKDKPLRGKLNGIIGQYLIVDQQVFNVRASAGYEVSFLPELLKCG